MFCLSGGGSGKARKEFGEETELTTYTAVLVTPGSRVYLPKFTGRINGALRDMRRHRDYPFLPVAIWPIDEDRFCRVAGLIELPAWKTIEWAAARFATMPIVQEWQLEACRYMGRIDPDIAAPLLLDWRRATIAKEVVAAREAGRANRLSGLSW